MKAKAVSKAMYGTLVLVAVLLVIWFVDYMGWGEADQLASSQPVVVNDLTQVAQGESASEATQSSTAPLEQVSYQIEEVVTSLEVPWSVVFTSDTRMLVTERPGRLRVVENGSLRSAPLHVFDQVNSDDEEGLMGMVLHSDYANNKFVYVCYAYPSGDGLSDKVVRFTDEGDSIANITTIIEDIPAARFHSGCELGFGPDGKLYITTGDATDRNIAQQQTSLGGKILRLNDDGTVPVDNPFENSPVWSLGHRNPQGLDWHPTTGVLYSSEHGPSGFDGPGGGDEINLIERGNNYGWPVVSHEESEEGFVDPKLVFTPAVAPGSLSFYASDRIPGFRNNFFFAALKGETLVRVVLDPANSTNILWFEKLPEVTYGRIREVIDGPDGALYFTTSNRDGRGSVQDGDDKILRIMPR